MTHPIVRPSPIEPRFNPTDVAERLSGWVKHFRVRQEYDLADLLDDAAAHMKEMERRDENERRHCLNWGPRTRMTAAQPTGDKK